MANDKRMDCVILGLLSHEPLTGYEIKKRIDNSLRFFWSGGYGSIYPTLNKLSEDGLVTNINDKESARGKIIYTITDSGRVYLRGWLQEPVIKDELRYETLVKLFFGRELGREETLKHIQRFEEKSEAELQILTMFAEQLKTVLEEEEHKYYLLTVMFGIETFRGYLRWCKVAKEFLIKER